jgi:hypothetical protein
MTARSASGLTEDPDPLRDSGVDARGAAARFGEPTIHGDRDKGGATFDCEVTWNTLSDNKCHQLVDAVDHSAADALSRK